MKKEREWLVEQNSLHYSMTVWNDPLLQTSTALLGSSQVVLMFFGQKIMLQLTAHPIMCLSFVLSTHINLLIYFFGILIHSNPGFQFYLYCVISFVLFNYNQMNRARGVLFTCVKSTAVNAALPIACWQQCNNVSPL